VGTSSYLGGTDREEENTWLWLDGTPWGYTNWDAGEPNGGMGENCLLFDMERGEEGYWIDVNCDGREGRAEGYICSYVNGKWTGSRHFLLQVFYS